MFPNDKMKCYWILVMSMLTMAIFNSCAGHGMTQYVVLNPKTGDSITDVRLYERYSKYNEDENSSLISVNSIENMCRNNPENVADVYVRNNEMKSVSCANIKNTVLDKFDQIDSVKILNGERYSGYEIGSIFMYAAAVDMLIGGCVLKNKISNAFEDEQDEKSDYFPLWGYVIGAAIGAGVAIHLYFDKNGSIIYMGRKKIVTETSSVVADSLEPREIKNDLVSEAFVN